MGCRSSSSTNVLVSQPKFRVAKDYVELEGRVSGEGVKQTKAWEATLTPTILQKKRQEFWKHFAVHRRSSYLYLRQASEADAATAKALLEMGRFVLENGTMAVCTSPEGHRYEFPPPIFSDPVKFKGPNITSI